MRIVTWNINGIRSMKDDWTQSLAELNADIVCIQETKVTRENLDEPTAIVEGYTSYFGFSRKRSGYSGVATFCKPEFTPSKCEEGLGGTLPSAKFDDAVGNYGEIEEEFSPDELKQLDAEGRCIITLHDVEVKGIRRNLVIFNVYCPRADCENPEREAYQLKFYKLLEIRANNLIRSGHVVIILGDINCSHKMIDHCDPYEEFGDRSSRRWLDHLLVSSTTSQSSPKGYQEWMPHSDKIRLPDHSFVDSFRVFHPERQSAFTCWNTKMKCRSNNYGTRLDYIFVSCQDAFDILIDCDIHPDIMGSDHCPVMATFQVIPLPSSKIPKYCTKNFPEFGGQQQKIASYFKQANEKRKIEEQEKSQDSKRQKVLQAPHQKSLLSFFKPTKSELKAATDQEAVEVLKPVELADKRNPEKQVVAAEAWKSLMKGPPTAPLCTKHKEPSELKTVKKKGPNCGRQFWCCARGEGKVGDPNTRCDFFKWVK